MSLSVSSEHKALFIDKITTDKEEEHVVYFLEQLLRVTTSMPVLSLEHYTSVTC